MKNRIIWYRIIPTLLCCCLLLNGCSILDFADQFRDSTKLTAKLHKSPRFWYDTVAVDGYSNLHQLFNEFFKGKPYNNIQAFGDNILLIGQGTYDKDKNSLIDQISDKFSNSRAADEDDENWDDESYSEENYNEDENSDGDISFEYSFDVYNPWKNSIEASLDHDQITCDDYLVAGDILYLIDSSSSTMDAYDSNLKFIQTIDISPYYVDGHLNLASSKGGTDYYFTKDNDNSLVKIDKCTFSSKIVNTGLYDPKVLALSNSGKHILLGGIARKTLRYQTAVFDTDNFERISSFDKETCQNSAISDSAFAFPYNSTYSDWLYSDYQGNEMYFYLEDLRDVKLIENDTMLLHQEEYFDASSTGNHTVSYYQMDNKGQCLSGFTFDCGYLTSSAFSYFSSDYVYLQDANCVMFLIYTTSVNPYILIWDLNDSGTCIDITSSDKEATVLAKAKEAYFAKQAEEATEQDGSEDAASYKDDSDYVVSLIDNPKTYDWGDLSNAYKQVVALEEKYNLEIYFGPEVPNTIDKFELNQDRDASHIAKSLNTLEAILNCYPENFFTQLCYGNIQGIRIYLAGNITGESTKYVEDASGFVTLLDNYQVMVLDTSYLWDWNYTANHEFAHMIDRRLGFLSVYNKNLTFSEDEWDLMNPKNFQYLNSYDNYENSKSYIGNESYFWDSYGTTYSTEDRAEIFGHVMDDYLIGQNYDEEFSEGSPLKDKLKYYCLCIRNGFDTSGWDAIVPWESLLH